MSSALFKLSVQRICV